MRHGAAVSIALLACAACGGGSRAAPERPRTVWSPGIEQEWVERTARGPDADIDLLEAFALLSSSIAARPLGAEDIRLENPEKAIQDYTLLLERHPGKALYWHNRGVCHGSVGQNLQALLDLDRAAFRANAKRLAEAVSDLNEAVALDPQDAKAYAMRAQVHRMMGEQEKARRDQERAASLQRGP